MKPNRLTGWLLMGSFLLLGTFFGMARAEMTIDDIVAPGTEPEVLGTGYGFCEGPTADAQGNVYFSDGKHNAIHFYEAGKPVALFVGDSTDANGQKISPQGELYTCEGAAYRVVAFDVATKKKRVLCDQIDGTHFNEPNDLTIDHLGGFYFTDPNYHHHGQKTVMKEDVYYCSPEGKVARVSTICVQPNGIQLTPDEKTLYLADCAPGIIYKYDVLGPGKLADGPARWIEVGAHPDGMTLDESGNLYLACGKAGVKVYSPQGKPIGTIKVPHGSNVCFGGSDFKTLFVTSVDKFLSVKTKVTGLKPLPLRVK